MGSLDDDMRRLSRRNRLIGLWAAEKMGLTDDRAEAYADGLAKLDFGPNDVIATVKRDFAAAGVVQSEAEITKIFSQATLAVGKPTGTADASDVALVQIVRNLRP